MNVFSQRLRFALEAKKMKQSQLAVYTGIDKSVISCYLSGKYEPKQENLFSIAKVLSVSPAWLAGHDVPIKDEEKSSLAGELSDEVVIYHRDGKTTVKKFSPEQIKAIHAFLEAMPGETE